MAGFFYITDYSYLLILDDPGILPSLLLDGRGPGQHVDAEVIAGVAVIIENWQTSRVLVLEFSRLFRVQEKVFVHECFFHILSVR